MSLFESRYAQARDLDCDRLVVPTSTGIVLRENGNCRFIEQKQIGCVAVVHFGKSFFYACGNDCGELVFLHYDTFVELERHTVCDKKIKNVIFHRKTNSLIIVVDSEIFRFSLVLKMVTQRVAIKEHNVVKLHGDMIFIGCSSGLIERFRICEDRITKMSDSRTAFHEGAVTGLSFDSTFFVSASRDHYLRFWSYHFDLIGEIWFPFPLLSCEIFNGKRHVLVAIEKAVLWISGKQIWGDDVDIFEPHIDNFDILMEPEDANSKVLGNDDHVMAAVEREEKISVEYAAAPEVSLPKLMIPRVPKKKRIRVNLERRENSRQCPDSSRERGPAPETSNFMTPRTMELYEMSASPRRVKGVMEKELKLVVIPHCVDFQELAASVEESARAGRKIGPEVKAFKRGRNMSIGKVKVPKKM
jgi:hypothetical protein